MEGFVFQTDRAFRPKLNIRNYTSLAKRFQELPTGPAWALVAPRRYGKTWALAGIKELLGDDAVVVNLQVQTRPALKKARVILVDEPSNDARWLALQLPNWKKEGKSIVIAMSPGEWADFSRPGSDSPLNILDLNEIAALSPGELHSLTSRADWAGSCAGLLPDDWKRSAFLAELILCYAEEFSVTRERPAELVRGALARAERCNYAQNVYLRGLSEEQRACLRTVRCSEGLRGEKEGGLLTRLGLLVREDGRHRIGDPILAWHLPPPLRIHHVSDVHFGPKAAHLGGEPRPSGTSGRIDGAVRESTFLADSYVECLRSRPEWQRPHVVVVSGDLAETGSESEFGLAFDWLDHVEGATNRHERADAGSPRVLVTGGNHDVDWSKALAGPDAQHRHRVFAERFARFSVPPLHQDPNLRPLHIIRFDEAGVEFVLLGSAQLGGEPDDRDFERVCLIEEVERLRSGLAGELTDAERDDIRSRIARVDSGFVHSADLKKLGQERRICPLRIAVLHHPISPMPTGGMGGAAVLANAGAVKEAFLNGEVHIVMHGHQHTSLVMCEEWPLRHSRRKLWILAAPSLGSKEVQEKHGFHEVELLRDMDEDGVFFRVTIQPFAHEGGVWQPHGPKEQFVVREDGTFDQGLGWRPRNPGARP